VTRSATARSVWEGSGGCRWRWLRSVVATTA
jgi:hypothetical protein